MEKPDQQKPEEFAAAVHAALESSSPIKKQKHFVTAGEKKFDRLTYTQIGYVANALLSVVAVAFIDRTHAGQKFIKGFGQWVEKNLKFLSPEKAEMLATKTFFLSGGFAVLAPMKFLEDAKVGLVKKWNRQIYGDKADLDPKIQQSEQELQNAPRQSWTSIAASRVLALVPFYFTYYVLWDRKSNLSKWTNGQFHGMEAEAVKAMEKDAPAEFSQLTAKGFYIDKPIAWVSRNVGKAFAWATGNDAALEKLKEMEVSYPGTIRSAITKDATHDPVHSAAPYYFISEAITSAMVAWGVYVLTRVTGPLFDKNKDHTMKPVPWQPSSSAIPITERREQEVAASQADVSEKPLTRVHAAQTQHEGVQHLLQHAQQI